MGNVLAGYRAGLQHFTFPDEPGFGDVRGATLDVYFRCEGDAADIRFGHRFGPEMRGKARKYVIEELRRQEDGPMVAVM
jgi:hypothetical protein